jgi:hypothetical protein
LPAMPRKASAPSSKNASPNGRMHDQPASFMSSSLRRAMKALSASSMAGSMGGGS